MQAISPRAQSQNIFVQAPLFMVNITTPIQKNFSYTCNFPIRPVRPPETRNTFDMALSNLFQSMLVKQRRRLKVPLVFQLRLMFITTKEFAIGMDCWEGSSSY